MTSLIVAQSTNSFSRLPFVVTKDRKQKLPFQSERGQRRNDYRAAVSKTIQETSKISQVVKHAVRATVPIDLVLVHVYLYTAKLICVARFIFSWPLIPRARLRRRKLVVVKVVLALSLAILDILGLILEPVRLHLA